MPNYGVIIHNKLISVPADHEHAKPLEYAEVPDYDQETQFVVQAAPEDRGDFIFVGVEVHDLEDTGEPDELI